MSHKKVKITNYCRRLIGVVLCLSPIGLLLMSVLSALVSNEKHAFDGAGFILAALFVASINFYLSYIRGFVWLRQHGSLDDYKHISGLPIIGTILIIIGGVFGFGAVGSAVLGLIAVALDTGGAPWFLHTTWCDSSFWDS